MARKNTTDWQAALGELLDSQELPQGDAEATEKEAVDEAPCVQKGRLDIVYERKGRAGKPATIIAGFTLTDDEVDSLASKMKRRMGCGGSARGGEILLQGDRRAAALEFLQPEGFKARII